MKRWGILLFGAGSYILFLGVFLYAVGFIGGFLVPTRLDGLAQRPWWQALAIDVGLVGLFAMQHSVMARPAFKRWWTQFVPEPIERSVYVLATNAVLAILFWLWQPLGGTIWNVEHSWGRAVLYGLFATGWLTVLATTFLIHHFDLFGLRQVWLYFRHRPYEPLGFVTPGPYRIVRHPLYVGWLLAFWATPTMGLAHLAFAVSMTVYILVAIRYEERDLAHYHGRRYELYRSRVPMLIPRLRTATTGRELETAGVATSVD